MLDINELREEIDEIDEQLVKLFEKRMEISLKVAQYKKKNNLPIINAEREKQVIEKNKIFIKNNIFEGATEEFLTKVMLISRKIQEEELSKSK